MRTIVIGLGACVRRLRARTAQGVLSMMTMGMLIYYTKELAAGYKPSTDPERLIAEAFNWSFPLFMDIPLSFKIWILSSFKRPDF